MTEIEVGDLVIVTGPLKLPNASVAQSAVGMITGEVAEVVETSNDPVHGYVVRVIGLESGYPGPDPNVGNYAFWIDPASLTPLFKIQDDPTVEWGDPADSVVPLGTAVIADYSNIHDYVYEADDE